MQDNDNYYLGIMAILLALTSFLLGGGKLMLTWPPTFQEALGVICLLGAFCIGIYLLVKGFKKSKTSKLLQNRTRGNKQVSINIGINSGDFTDDRMSKKRMDDFHKMVKDIAEDSKE
jgi:hypothetical protein